MLRETYRNQSLLRITRYLQVLVQILVQVLVHVLVQVLVQVS